MMSSMDGFGRTHSNAAMQVVKLWREDLAHINPKAAESLADPAQYPNLFPNLDLALHAEQYQVCPPGSISYSLGLTRPQVAGVATAMQEHQA